MFIFSTYDAQIDFTVLTAKYFRIATIVWIADQRWERVSIKKQALREGLALIV
jgi:hypothetical protein